LATRRSRESWELEGTLLRPFFSGLFGQFRLRTGQFSRGLMIRQTTEPKGTTPFSPAVNRNCSSVDRRAEVAAAFTLVEALLAISVAALAGSVLLLGISSSLQMADEALQQALADGMAQQLMDEVVGGRYHGVGVGPYQITFSPSAYELAGSARERYDDVDDYDGVRSQPPTDPWGIELGRDDGVGGERHPNFQAPPGFFDKWRQEVDVYYVGQSDLSTALAGGQVSDYRAVVVRIVYVDPERGERVLAELRRVVAYVPPL